MQHRFNNQCCCRSLFSRKTTYVSAEGPRFREVAELFSTRPISVRISSAQRWKHAGFCASKKECPHLSAGYVTPKLHLEATLCFAAARHQSNTSPLATCHLPGAPLARCHLQLGCLDRLVVIVSEFWILKKKKQ